MNEGLNDALVRFLVEVLLGLLAVGLPILGAYLRGLMVAAAARYHAATTAEQRGVIDSIIRMAVLAAEQTGLADAAMQAGAAKKSLALRAAQEALDRRGIHLDVRELDSRIEAMVLDEFNRPAPATPPAEAAPAQ